MSSPIRSRALALLSSGITPEQTAAALGVTPSAISQLISDAEFANELATARFEKLKKNNARDEELDSLEDELITIMKQQMALIAFDTNKIPRLFSIINAAKRRGASAPESAHTHNTIIQLNVPVSIVSRFRVNSNNQVVSAGSQDLITIQSGNMRNLVESQNHEPQRSLPNLPSGETVEIATIKRSAETVAVAAE